MGLLFYYRRLQAFWIKFAFPACLLVQISRLLHHHLILSLGRICLNPAPHSSVILQIHFLQQFSLKFHCWEFYQRLTLKFDLTFNLLILCLHGNFWSCDLTHLNLSYFRLSLSTVWMLCSRVSAFLFTSILRGILLPTFCEKVLVQVILLTQKRVHYISLDTQTANVWGQQHWVDEWLSATLSVLWTFFSSIP